MFRRSPIPDRVARPLAVVYLLVQCAALAAYWIVLRMYPETRDRFLAPGAPDSTLMAFMAGDLIVYANLSLVSALGLIRKYWWCWGALCAHAGAAVYAGWYALALSYFEPARTLGLVMMAPALLVSPLLVWQFMPRAPRQR